MNRRGPCGGICGSLQPVNLDSDDRQQMLAFSGAEGLVSAKSRSHFTTQDGTATLNVECFGSAPDSGQDDSDWPIILFVHGVCESAETWTVQHLAVAAREHLWRMFVLELEGHGLSSGKRAMCGDFDRLCGHIGEFVQHVISGDNEDTLFALCGSSLGGVLCAYGADAISRSDNGVIFQNFLGAALVAPAIGIAPETLPSAPIVGALRLLSAVAPSAGFLTPVEDPTHYACPETSTRNFSGHWPLSTSKMLLDITSTKVQKDQATGQLQLNLPSLLVIAGEKDDIVPLNTVRKFFEEAKTEDKSFVGIPKADHGLMVEQRTADIAIDHLFQWLQRRIG